MADIALSVARSLATKAAEKLVAPVVTHCGYLIFANRNIRQLKGDLEKLGEERADMQDSIDEARNNLREIKTRVENWVKEVQDVTDKANNVLKYDETAKKTCFCKWLPNPKVRYGLGKKASETVKDIQKLITQVQQDEFEKVDRKNPAPGLVGTAADVNFSAGDVNNIVTDSRASIFHNVMKALDNEELKVIGVYGPGGVGKSKLLKEVEKKLRKEGRPFHMILKANVSQTPDLKKIQDDIAYALDLKLNDVTSEQGRRDLLFRRLQRDRNKKILIILDNLWEELDLSEVGIPSGDENMGCQVLLTSRYKDVLQQKMRASPIFHLEGLTDHEAFTLFEKNVGDRLKVDEAVRAIAPQVVKQLAGLPLLIISVATTLKNSDVSAWRNASKKIDEKGIETIVKLSYDHLENEDAKSLFLLCGLIGGTIQVELLLGLGLGLGLFEGFNKTMQDSRDRLNTTLDILRSACLLLDGGDDKDSATIHDLYSEVVVSTPFRGQNSLMMNRNYGSWSKERLEKCWAICQVDVGSDVLAELMSCQFPNLKILMLSQPAKSLGRPANRPDVGDCCRLDFAYMKELRVLHLRSMHITALPSSTEILGNLQSLYFDHCDVEDVAILGKLKALQILSFAGSTITRLPKEIGELTKLRSLNLSNCKDLKTIEPGVLQGLINLEELKMRGSFDRWMGKDEIPSALCNARLIELKSLTKLITLEISIPDPHMLLEDADLPFWNMIRFWIDIGHVLLNRFEDLITMKLKLDGCDPLLSREWVKRCLQKTQYLHLDGLRDFDDTRDLSIQRSRELQHLDICNSSSIKYIADSSGPLPLTAFVMLESLFLDNLINLEKIWNGLITSECFSKLKSLKVSKCNRLKNLWYLSETQRLVQLEEIQVRECDSMQAIVMSDAGEDEVAADDIVELPNIRRLELRNLPNMTSFCSGAEIASEGALIEVIYSYSPCVTLSC